MSKILDIIKMRKFTLLLIISVVGVLLLLSYIYKQHTIITEKTAQIEAIIDTVRIYKTKDNKNAAEKKILIGSRKELLAITKLQDKKLNKLLEENKKAKSITRLETETRIDTITKADTVKIYVNDTTKIVDSIYITKNIKNEYYQADIKVKDDSVSLGLKVQNKFSIVAKEKSNGLFKPNSYVIVVVNDNPYTITTDLNSIEIKPKKKLIPRILTYIAIGVGVFLLAK